MKKFFERIGMVSLVCFSFFFTEKTVGVLKESDEIMISIRQNAKKKQTKGENAKIEEDTIIPGIYGELVDEEKSYEKMKRVGSYQENLLVYKKVAPEISLNKQFDKYIISGNPKKNMVSLLFLVEKNDNTEKLEAILKQKNIKASFFVDGTWFENHNEKILEWINNDYTIGNLSYNHDYTNSSFIWMDTIIKKIGNQKISFCYNENKEDESLQICAMNKNFTIKPTFIVNQNPLSEIKQNLAPGSIISFPLTQEVISELPVLIEYIKGKGYKLENLSHHLEEQ